MFDDIKEEFVNCPQVFRNNCVNQHLKCNRCKAKEESNRDFLYVPHPHGSPELSYKKHPCFILLKDKNRQSVREVSRIKKESASYLSGKRYNRQGKKKEKQILKSNNIEQTFGSGRFKGDGDGRVIINGISYGVEHKTRFNNRNIYSLTKKEWEKAKNQRVDIGIISSEEGSYVNLSLESFMEMINNED
jgi:hypothetical protein